MDQDADGEGIPNVDMTGRKRVLMNIDGKMGHKKG